MVRPSTRERFHLTLFVEGGRMPLTFFARTAEDLRQLLRAIEEAQLGEAPHAQWEVEADRIEIAASVNGISAEDLESIITDAHQSLRAATGVQDDETPIPIPDTVSEKGRRLTRSIVKRARRTAPVTIDAPGQEPIHIEPEPREVDKVAIPTGKRRRQEVQTARGAVDGELDVISVRRRPYFVIYEHGTNNQIRCTFPDDWMDTVKELLGGRVIAEGLLRYRPDGTVSSLSEPTAVNPVQEPERSMLGFRGALPGISGGLSSADYIKQLRTLDWRG